MEPVSAQPGLKLFGLGQGVASPVRYDLLISGSYAWLVTVATSAWGATNGWALVTAFVAIAHLWFGVWVSRRRAALGRVVTIAGFLGFCAVTWVLLGERLYVANVEPIRAALGALGWVLFALSWGAVRRSDEKPEDDPRFVRGAEVLTPRQALPRATLLTFALTVVCAFAPWLAAWAVVRREHALLAHALGLGGAMWILVGGSQIAVSLGAHRTWPAPRARISAALAPLAWACALLAAGALYRVSGGAP